MSEEQGNLPKRTALYEVHQELGARFTDFGGWDMPLKYGKELEEHRAVREKVGLFDLSHMGEVRVTGSAAAEFLDYALISRLSTLAPGKAKYSMICQEDGGIIDDLITYRIGEEEFLVIPNAGNAPRVVQALEDRAQKFQNGVKVQDESADTSLVAIQGPDSAALLVSMIDDDQAKQSVTELKYYSSFTTTIAGHPVLVARTGYTGEDGFEIFVANTGAKDIWDSALRSGEAYGIIPCGLASRDTLRLEAGMPLYGHELSTEVTPVDAGLGVIAATEAGEEFVGAEAIRTLKKQGASRCLIGLVGEGKRAARAGYDLYYGEKKIGSITSGALSPTLGYPVAMAYVDNPHTPGNTDQASVQTPKQTPESAGDVEGSAVDYGAVDYSHPGTELSVDIRGKRVPYTVVKTPFYRRKK